MTHKIEPPFTARHKKVTVTHGISECDLRRITVARVGEYLRCLFKEYAQDIRRDYPGFICRNATVVESGILEFERRGWAKLIADVSEWPHWMQSRTRLKNLLNERPIWLPTATLLKPDPFVYMKLKPFIRKDQLSWIWCSGPKFN